VVLADANYNNSTMKTLSSYFHYYFYYVPFLNNKNQNSKNSRANKGNKHGIIFFLLCYVVRGQNEKRADLGRMG